MRKKEKKSNGRIQENNKIAKTNITCDSLCDVVFKNGYFVLTCLPFCQDAFQEPIRKN